MKCPVCKDHNITPNQHQVPLGSKITAGRTRHALAKSGHPVGAAIVLAIQVGTTVNETFYHTYTCRNCGHVFTKFQSWKF